MALTIVRNDITKMQADAIVNTTNEHFEVGGLGVDAGIHYAAGPRLKDALSAIGYCPVGSAVITEAFDIPTCRYIIHTVGPVYTDGKHGEKALLESCYRSILALAREKGCRSLAIPLISTGAYGYPKREAYGIATACIREFLLSLPDDEDLMVYIVLYDREAVAVSEKVDAGVKRFISEVDRRNTKSMLRASYEERGRLARYGNVSSNRPERRDVRRAKDALSAEEAAPHAETAPVSPPPDEDYRKEDRSFADMCEWWCERKGLSKKEFYIRANLNKAMFWSLKHNTEQVPRKTSALACVIGLKLDWDQALDLLQRAGLTLSRYYALDLIVEYCIRHGNYDIDEVNALLYEKDLPLLGSYS